MYYWTCWMDDASIDRFRRELGVSGIRNRVEVPAEHDLPPSHARQVALDAFMVLARQENPELDSERMHALREELVLHCEPSPGQD